VKKDNKRESNRISDRKKEEKSERGKKPVNRILCLAAGFVSQRMKTLLLPGRKKEKKDLKNRVGTRGKSSEKGEKGTRTLYKTEKVGGEGSSACFLEALGSKALVTRTSKLG